MTSEHPIFVPFGEQALAAVVTVPEGRPCRGVVLLLQGQGASGRANKYRLWVRAARKLADRGIACIRMDLPGTGDSTGSRPETVDDFSTPEATAVLDVVLQALGVEAFGLAGHCYGAQAFFEVAEDPRCRGVGFILFADPRYLVGQPQPVVAATPAPVLPGPLAQARWKREVRRLPGMKALVRQRRRRRARRRPWPAEFVQLVGRTPTLFLSLRPERPAREIARAVGHLRRRVPSSAIDVEAVLHTGALARMPHAKQEELLDKLADWFDSVIPAAERVVAPEPVPAVAGAE
jgi:pimeloyl-ACP methyl ester carboxylesterase